MRAVPEWIGATADTPIPPRVKARVVLAQDGRCAICGAKFVGKVTAEFDHRIALINGGENRESNLQALCALCHAPKTRRDVAQKAKDARVRQKHAGIAAPKRKIPGSKGTGWRKPLNGPAYRVKE